MQHLRKNDENKQSETMELPRLPETKKQRESNGMPQKTTKQTTTCCTTIGRLHNKPIEELLETKSDIFYYIRLNLEQEYEPMYSHMYHTKT